MMKFNDRERSLDYINLSSLEEKSERYVVKEFSRDHKSLYGIIKGFSSQHFSPSPFLKVSERIISFSEINAEFLRESISSGPLDVERIKKLLDSLQPLEEQKFKKIKEQVNIQVNIMIIKELIDMVERGKTVPPDLIRNLDNLEVDTHEMVERLGELYRLLDSKISKSPPQDVRDSYEKVMQKIWDLGVDYARRKFFGGYKPPEYPKEVQEAEY